mmetsp:Transcript_19817/g.43108  ORF Transcript_19817/g.43108 Transcript_19817/m.43108 type:complete len:212 (-) Transcript_19817:1445-2080(-)
MLLVLLHDSCRAGSTLAEGAALHAHLAEARELAPDHVGYRAQGGGIRVGVRGGWWCVHALGVLHHSCQELNRQSASNRGKTWSRHSALLVQGAVSCGVDRGHDVITEVAAQTMTCVLAPAISITWRRPTMPHDEEGVKAHCGGDCHLAMCSRQHSGQPAALPCVSQQEDGIMAADQGIQAGQLLAHDVCLLLSDRRVAGHGDAQLHALRNH